MKPRFHIGEREASNSRFAIVVSQWNEFLTSRLVDGALDALATHGAAKDAAEVFKVPGAFELPLACLKAAESGRFNAVIALGLVLRGETPHFDYVAGEAARGVTEASLKSGVPVLFGVITADTVGQAVDRCGSKSANKGYEAAMAAIEIVNLYRKMELEQGIKGKEKKLSHGV
ncbi:MAG: 6,7-dimethyl-8-ribityllumazine synthase [Pyrinomonadaceae bacterium]